LLHEEKQFSKPSMLDKFSLNVDSVEEHGGQSNDDHFLVNFVDLCEWLQDPWHDFVLDYLLLAIFLHAQVADGSDNISEDFFLFFVVEELKEYLKEAFLAQVAKDFGILGQVAHQFDHEAHQLISFVLVDGIGQAVLNRGDFRFMDEVPVQLGLACHVAQSDAGRLNQVDLVLLRRVEQMNEGLDLPLLRLRALKILSSCAL
jgi:hypothetical protein